jgi:predicted DNA-binding ribbon-helix-helix protein
MSNLRGADSQVTESSREHQEKNRNGFIRSRVVKRSVNVGGHKTSVSLENEFWNELRAISQERNLPLAQLVGGIDGERQHGNLSSAIRLFVLEQRCANRSRSDSSISVL